MEPIDNPFSGEEGEGCDPEHSPDSPPADSTAFVRACEDDGGNVKDAWGHLRAGASSDAQLSQESPAEQSRQQAVLIELAKQTEWQISDAEIQQLPILSNRTSEHEVRLASARCVLKMTWPGWYGQVPMIVDGKLRRAPATPAQYLDRIGLDRLVFNGEIKLSGFCVSDRPSLIIGEPPGQPSIVVAQPFYTAAASIIPTRRRKCWRSSCVQKASYLYLILTMAGYAWRTG